jgi:uncharacterized protein
MTNIDTIKRLYQLFAVRDNEEIRKIFAADIVWSQMDGFPNGGTYIGADAIFENVFAGFREHWTIFNTVVTEYVDASSSVMVIGYYEGIYEQTGRPVKAAFVHRYHLKKGKIIRFTQYTDTYLIAKAMGTHLS